MYELFWQNRVGGPWHGADSYATLRAAKRAAIGGVQLAYPVNHVQILKDGVCVYTWHREVPPLIGEEEAGKEAAR